MNPRFLDLGTGWEWSASCSGRFTPGERAPGTHCIGGWLGPRTGLDMEKILAPTEIRTQTPWSSSAIFICISHYT
jgi:hypothetical protein